MKFSRLLLAMAMLWLSVPVVFASQGSGCVKTTGTFNGLQENTDINAANAAFISMNSGATAPATDCSGVAVKGQFWLQTVLNSVNLYDGANWLYLGLMDTVNHIWKPVVGGGVETLAGAATTDVCSVPGSVVNISGVATITSFGSSCTPGSMKMLVFTGASTLTNSSALLLPGRLPINTSAGDTALAFYLGSGNWQLSYTNASGQAIVNPAVEVGTVQWSMAAGLPANGKYVFGGGQAISRASFPDFVAAVTRAQNGTRTSGSPTLSSVADTSGMGVGMPIEGAGIPAATVIVSVSPSSITMSANAASPGTNSVTVFFTGYGASGTTSTVGVPDCRGRAMAGRDDMNGTPAGRLTTAYFGAGSATPSAAALNAAGGVESNFIVTANTPPYTPSGSIANGAITSTVVNGAFGGSGQSGAQPSSPLVLSGLTGIVISSTQAPSTFLGSAQGGTSAPFRVQPPTLIANCIVRVLAFNFPIPSPLNDNDALVIYDRRFA